MNYKVKTTITFEKKAKKLIKKYASLKNEIFELIQSLKTNPNQGINLGKSCYKIRISIASKGKGKSGSARIITNIAVLEETVYLLSIYDKSEQEIISENEIQKLLNDLV